jgi:ribosomal protein S17
MSDGGPIFVNKVVAKKITKTLKVKVENYYYDRFCVGGIVIKKLKLDQ